MLFPSQPSAYCAHPTKKAAGNTPTASKDQRLELLCKARLDQLDQAIDCSLLIRAVREPGAAPSHLHLPPSLIIRRSVRNLLL